MEINHCNAHTSSVLMIENQKSKIAGYHDLSVSDKSCSFSLRQSKWQRDGLSTNVWHRG